MNLPPIDEVINALNNLLKTVNLNLPNSFTSEQLSTLNKYRKELLLKIAEIKQLDFDLLSSIATAIEFVPFSSYELQEYDEIYECIYDGSAAFYAEGIIDRYIAHAAELLNIESLDDSFVSDNRDEIIEECMALDGYEGNNDNLSVYSNPIDYVFYWIRITVIEYLKFDYLDDDEADSWFSENEVVLRPYYQTITNLTNLGIY